MLILRLSWRLLKGRVLIWLIVCLIALSLSATILVHSVLNGLYHNMLKNWFPPDGIGDVIALDDRGAHIPTTSQEDMLGRLSSLDDIGSLVVSPILETPAVMVKSGSRDPIPFHVLGVRPEVAGQVSDRHPLYQTEWQGQGLCLSSRAAQRHGLKVGDQLTMVTFVPPKVTDTFSLPKAKSFKNLKVSAITYSGKQPFVDTAWMALPRLQKILNKSGDFAEISYCSIGGGRELIPDIVEHLNKQEELNRDLLHFWFRPFNERGIAKQYQDELENQKRATAFLMFLIVVMACTAVLVVLIMWVQEKKHLIGIVRAMGMTQGQVIRLVGLCGMSMGLLGILAGTTLGCVISDEMLLTQIELWSLEQFNWTIFGADLYDRGEYFPCHLDHDFVILVSGCTFLIVFLASVIPAYVAARKDPVECLANE